LGEMREKRKGKEGRTVKSRRLQESSSIPKKRGYFRGQVEPRNIFWFPFVQVGGLLEEKKISKKKKGGRNEGEGTIGVKRNHQ